MQTKSILFMSIFGIISGLCFSTNQNVLLSVTTALIAAIFGLAAYFSKDKKDKQIEDIHDITTTKLGPYLAKATHTTTPAEEPKQTLSKTHEDVLNLLFKEPTEIKNICKVLSLSTEEVKFYLDGLRKIDMVSMPPIYPAGPGNWNICQKGREYVMAHRASEKIARDAWNAHT